MRYPCAMREARYPGCLITDICLPGIDGMQLQQALISRDMNISLIAISTHGDISMAVEMVSGRNRFR